MQTSSNTCLRAAERKVIKQGKWCWGLVCLLRISAHQQCWKGSSGPKKKKFAINTKKRNNQPDTLLLKEKAIQSLFHLLKVGRLLKFNEDIIPALKPTPPITTTSKNNFQRSGTRVIFVALFFSHHSLLVIELFPPSKLKTETLAESFVLGKPMHALD